MYMNGSGDEAGMGVGREERGSHSAPELCHISKPWDSRVPPRSLASLSPGGRVWPLTWSAKHRAGRPPELHCQRLVPLRGFLLGPCCQRLALPTLVVALGAFPGPRGTSSLVPCQSSIKLWGPVPHLVTCAPCPHATAMAQAATVSAVSAAASKLTVLLFDPLSTMPPGLSFKDANLPRDVGQEVPRMPVP